MTMKKIPSTRTRIKSALLIVSAAVLIGGGVARADTADIPAALVPPPTASRTATFSARALVSHAEAALTAGHPGRAILDYERARLAAPRAPAIAAGLARAQAAANIPPPEPSRPARAARWLGADAWAGIAMGGIVTIALAFAALAWGLVRRRGFFVLATAAAAIGSLALLTAHRLSPPLDRAVVLAPDMVARIAPFAQAEPAFTAPEGSTVTVERVHDGYSLIAAPAGRGWVPSAAVETIVPPAAPAAHRT